MELRWRYGYRTPTQKSLKTHLDPCKIQMSCKSWIWYLYAIAIDGVRWQKHYLCMPKCMSFKSNQSFFIQQNGGHLQYFTTLSLSLFLPKYTIFWTQMYISKMNVFLSDHNLGLPCVWAERLLIGTWLEGWWGERQSPYRQYGLPLRRERIEGTFQKNYFGNKCSSPFFWKKTVYQVKASL